MAYTIGALSLQWYTLIPMELLFPVSMRTSYHQLQRLILTVGISSPSHEITDFVKSWSKYTFDDIDCLTDRALRDKSFFSFFYLPEK
jgi:hypothetical protein